MKNHIKSHKKSTKKGLLTQDVIFEDFNKNNFASLSDPIFFKESSSVVCVYVLKNKTLRKLFSDIMTEIYEDYEWEYVSGSEVRT